MQTGGSLTAEQCFSLGRFGSLLARRLQVELALQNAPRSEIRRSWLVRALDSAIADQYAELKRLQLEPLAAKELASFRATEQSLPNHAGVPNPPFDRSAGGSSAGAANASPSPG
jgi:hypothetical protein